MFAVLTACSAEGRDQLTAEDRGVLFESNIVGPSEDSVQRPHHNIFRNASNPTQHGIFVGRPRFAQEDFVNVVMTSPVNVVSVTMSVISGDATSVVMFTEANEVCYNETVRSNGVGWSVRCNTPRMPVLLLPILIRPVVLPADVVHVHHSSTKRFNAISFKLRDHTSHQQQRT